MSRGIAFTWGLGVVLTAASPLLRDPLADDFPLSTFPMFAVPVEQAMFYSAEGVRGDGSRVQLPPELIANGAAMQAVETMRNAHAQGSRALRQLCERVAARAGQTPALDLQRVELVSARYDPVAYFVVSAEPIEREVLRKCQIRPAR
jgi:hypothetical protein